MKMFRNLGIVALASMAIVACGQVPAGNVGVKVQNLGEGSGVVQEEVGVGYEWLGIGTDMYLFPTFEQNYVWTRGQDEGSRNDESFTFQDVDGLSIGADIGISYQIVPEMASDLFETYRMGIDEITDQRIRNMVRDALNAAASTRTAEEIYGAGRVGMMQEVEDSVRSRLEVQGIVVNDVYWIGSLRLPPQVVAAIEAKVRADQEAAQRENQIATAEAQAQIEIAEANGRAESMRLEAQGRADARRIEAQAEADALRVQGEALAENPDIITLNAIESWEAAGGPMPNVWVQGGAESGTLPILDLVGGSTGN